jgi:hypothetical protein
MNSATKWAELAGRVTGKKAPSMKNFSYEMMDSLPREEILKQVYNLPDEEVQRLLKGDASSGVDEFITEIYDDLDNMWRDLDPADRKELVNDWNRGATFAKTGKVVEKKAPSADRAKKLESESSDFLRINEMAKQAIQKYVLPSIDQSAETRAIDTAKSVNSIEWVETAERLHQKLLNDLPQMSIQDLIKKRNDAVKRVDMAKRNILDFLDDERQTKAVAETVYVAERDLKAIDDFVNSKNVIGGPTKPEEGRARGGAASINDLASRFQFNDGGKVGSYGYNPPKDDPIGDLLRAQDDEDASLLEEEIGHLMSDERDTGDPITDLLQRQEDKAAPLQERSGKSFATRALETGLQSDNIRDERTANWNRKAEDAMRERYGPLKDEIEAQFPRPTKRASGGLVDDKYASLDFSDVLPYKFG